MSNYEEVYLENWKDIVEDEKGNLDLEQVKKELADYTMILEEVPKAYEHLTGLSKPHTRASAIIDIVEANYIRRQETFDDLLQYADNDVVTISVESLKEYLLT